MQSKSLAMCLHIKKMDLMMKKTGLTSLEILELKINGKSFKQANFVQSNKCLFINQYIKF